MFSRRVPANKVGSWLTSPMCERKDLKFILLMFLPSINTFRRIVEPLNEANNRWLATSALSDHCHSSASFHGKRKFLKHYNVRSRRIRKSDIANVNMAFHSLHQFLRVCSRVDESVAVKDLEDRVDRCRSFGYIRSESSCFRKEAPAAH